MTRVIAQGEWRNWPALLASTIGIVFAMMYVYSLGVMIAPLEEAFGWSRADITAGKIVMGIVGLLLAPVAGSMIDRFGPRRVALIGMPLYCLSFASLAGNQGSLLLWQLQWGLIACGYVLVAPATWAAMTSMIFHRSRGLALAITLSGTGIAALFIPVLTNWLLVTFGWRGAYVGLPLVLLAVFMPPIFFLFKNPSTAGIDVLTNSSVTARHDAEPHLAPRPQASTQPGKAHSSPKFIMLAAAATIFSLAISVITLNSVPILISKGMSPTTAAEIAGVLGVGLIIGRIGGGYLLDRLPANRVASVLVLLPLCATALLLGWPGEALPAIIALVAVGLATGAEYDACAFLAARHFGVANFGKLFGIISGLLIFSSSISPFISNYAYDVTNSYDLAIMAYVPAGLIASLLFWLVGSGPDQE